MTLSFVFLIISLLANVGLIVATIVFYRLKGQQEKAFVDLTAAHEKVRSEKSFLDGQISELAIFKQHLHAKEQELSSLVAKESEYAAQIARLQTQQEQQAKSHEEKLVLLLESKQQLAIEFEQLADKLLDKKTDRLKEQQDNFFAQTVKPLKEQLSEFRQRIDSVHEMDAKDRVQLLGEITQLKTLNQQMSGEAINLTNALKGNQKFQGNWGEFVLDRVLEDSGLRKGFEYEIQAKRYSEDGRLRLPDVIVHLPDKKDLIIDAKVSLVDYQRFCESTDPVEKERALKGHLRSLEQHIKGLSVKDYEALEGINSLDFVLLFVPIEAAFLLALESDPGLFQQAYDKHIILVSPTTLLATLRTVENLWRYERQNKNAEEIARQAGGLYDQCVLFLESLEEIGKQLHRSTDAFEKSIQRLSTGRGSMLSRVNKMKRLGAKTKKQLPEHFVLGEDDLDALTDDTEEN